MSPTAAEARLTRTMSSSDLFAPKGGFSCPAFNSLPYSLDFDFSDLNPSNPNVLMYDGLELSPLASSFQMWPHLGAKVFSPPARVKKPVTDASRGCNAGGDRDRQWRLMVQHQQPQHRPRKDSEGEKGGSETDYTTPTTEPTSTCKPNDLRTTSSHVQTPGTKPAGVTRSTNADQSRARGRVESEESIWDRAFSASIRMLESTKRSLPQMPVTEAAQTEAKPQKKRRVVKKDPNKPKPKPWSESELAQFRKLVKAEGANNWAKKAAKLGTKRSAKSLHTRWLREEGRIVDRPRGAAAMRQNEIEAATKDK